MTKDEAIDYNKNLKMYMKMSDKNNPCKFLEENYVALDMAIKALEQKPESEIKPIGYRECSNAMLKMWMDNVLTDGEYYRIMNKLNAKWSRILESEGEE